MKAAATDCLAAAIKLKYVFFSLDKERSKSFERPSALNFFNGS